LIPLLAPKESSAQFCLTSISLWHPDKNGTLKYKQRATPPRRWCQVSWATPWQETYLAQTHFHKMETTRNHPH
jgi:hypothetical protein